MEEDARARQPAELARILHVNIEIHFDWLRHYAMNKTGIESQSSCKALARNRGQVHGRANLYVYAKMRERWQRMTYTLLD